MADRRDKRVAAEKAVKDALTERDAFIQSGLIEELDDPRPQD